jgi:meso-butanediol dehydrogenase/(S,S)-butanediol dehydrogenase/diacetyl reductase
LEDSVEGQVAIITGSGQGIGRAIARRLAQDGMRIVVADIQYDRATQVAEEFRQYTETLPLQIDVTQDADRQRMLVATLETWGRLDVLVNNAAIQRVAHPLDVTEEHWDAVMNVNARSVFFCCQIALRHMAQARSGRIINIASMAGKTASTIYHPVYNVSKAAVIAMTKTFAQAYAADGIRVNAICPGIVETPMQDVVDAEFARVTGRMPSEIRAERTGKIPMGRVEQPEDVAAVVSFLAGPDSRYMTGQSINVTGGMITY